MRNTIIFIMLSGLYFIYVVNIFFEISINLSIFINILGMPVIVGMMAYLIFIGETWIKISLITSIPVIPLLFSGYYVDTEGFYLVYIGPVMLFFSIGAGMMYLFVKLYAKFK